MKFNLGDEVRDKYSGNRGIITAITQHISGHVTYRFESLNTTVESWEQRLELANRKEEVAGYNPAMQQVCAEILSIMDTYHEQKKSKYGVGTPGGLEHMGDVWSLFMRWEEKLKKVQP